MKTLLFIYLVISLGAFTFWAWKNHKPKDDFTGKSETWLNKYGEAIVYGALFLVSIITSVVLF